MVVASRDKLVVEKNCIFFFEESTDYCEISIMAVVIYQ
jgi:hypothetical protein